MAVRHEIKSQLAKLLATEDLVVENKKCQTAQFNVHTRVLTLPMWEKASNTVYDLLVGHEVGHALYTPDENWLESVKVPPMFVNVVEDARIEKLMKRRYAGLAKTFYTGYKELVDEDFFEIKYTKIDKMNLADRANLWFKIGNFTQIPIESGEETEIMNMIADTETFADTLIAAEALYKYCKSEKEKKEEPIETNQSQKPGSGSPASEIDFENNEEQEGESESNSTQPEQSDDSYGGTAQGEDIQVGSGFDGSEPEIKTVNNLEENIRNLVNDNGYDNIYVEIPKLNLDTVIAKNSDVHKAIDDSFSHQQKIHDEHEEKNAFNLYNVADAEFKKFKVSAQKEVNYLVKEFECKKAADQYSRSNTARTGILDTARLHTYKYNEDLFKKVSVIPDGKNHGLVFVLDWSGSMQHTLLDTCKQLFNLIWFCKKVSIPFEVYAFTNEWRSVDVNYATGLLEAVDRTLHYEKKEYLLHVDESFSMMNLFTSKVSASILEHQMKNIWRLATHYTYPYSTAYTYPRRLSLSGTPLNEALMSLHQILPVFKKENKLQKVQCIVLTDGEAAQVPYHISVKRSWESEPYLGTRGISPGLTFLRDRKLGTTYMFDYAHFQFTDVLLKNLKDKFSDMNFIGIRILSGRDASRFIHLYNDYNTDEYNKLQTSWKKMKSFTIKNSGYDAYFAIATSILSQDSEFDVQESATKAQIKSAFAKSLQTKKLNKKVLGEFISLVA